MVTPWRYWEGIRLVIYRSWVQVLAGLDCVVALGKLLVCMCASVTKQYNLVPVKGGGLFPWQSNWGPGGKLQEPTTGFMSNVTGGLTAKKPRSAPCQTFVIKYGTTTWPWCWQALPVALCLWTCFSGLAFTGLSWWSASKPQCYRMVTYTVKRPCTCINNIAVIYIWIHSDTEHASLTEHCNVLQIYPVWLSSYAW